MTDRITEKNLQAMCDRLNRLTGSPMTAYAKGADGKVSAQIGNYHIDYAYGGAMLARMCNDGGGITNPLGTGHIPKRDLYNLIHAFIRGIEESRTEIDSPLTEAAPDLLAALERLTIVAEGCGWLRRPGDAIEEARAAIAKAEGRS